MSFVTRKAYKIESKCGRFGNNYINVVENRSILREHIFYIFQVHL